MATLGVNLLAEVVIQQMNQKWTNNQ